MSSKSDNQCLMVVVRWVLRNKERAKGGRIISSYIISNICPYMPLINTIIIITSYDIYSRLLKVDPLFTVVSLAFSSSWILFFLSAGSLFSGGLGLSLKLERDQVGKKLVSLHSRIIRLATSGDLERGRFGQI